jgi:hypothetical protein
MQIFPNLENLFDLYLRNFLFNLPGYVPVVPTFSTATSYCGAS